MLEDHEKPVFVSLAARDWAECQNENSESIAQERLNFLRGMLFENDPASRIKNIQITRQSSAAKFRNYAENARWESNGILFATINLPAGNNHYLAAAGRNNEFEDRLVANRVWLQRIFTYAKTHKIKGIVLFSDGNPMVVPAKSSRNETRDGFLEVRKQLTSLGARYAGKILLIHGQPSSGNITWRENIGTVGAGKFTLDITAKPGTTVLYSISRIGSASAKNNSSAKK